MNREQSNFDEIIASLNGNSGITTVTSLNPSARAFFLGKAYDTLNRDMLVIAPSSGEAEKLFTDLRFFLEPDQPLSGWHQRVFFLPGYEVLPFQGISPPVEIVARRLGTLFAMHAEDRPVLVVTYPAAAMQKVIPRTDLSDHSELLIAEEETDREALLNRLTEGGYFRTQLVEQKGDFAVRGDLLDIFAPHYEYPVRIEFFGDYVESIRLFDVGSQRSFADLEELVVLPVSELIRTPAHIKRALSKLKKDGEKIPDIPSILEQLESGNIFVGAESIMPYFYGGAETLSDYCSRETMVAYIEQARLENLAEEESRQWSRLVEVLGDDSPFLSWADFEKTLNRFQRIRFSTIFVEGEGDSDKVYRVRAESNEELKNIYGGHSQNWEQKRQMIDMLQDWLNMRLEINWITHGPKRTRELHDFFSEYGFPTRMEKPPFLRARHSPGTVRIFSGSLSQGFRLWDEAVVVLTDDEMYGPKKKVRKSSRSRLDAYVSSFEDLKQDDLVVHAEHGVGRYEGLVQLSLDGVPNDFLLILYKDEDKLYIPVHNLKLIQKYIGVDGQAARLDKLGGKSWNSVKRKVKRSVEKMARELLATFAARNSRQGKAFSKGNGHMREFEEGFPYEETPDQARAIEDVLTDMESPRPMDRLVCGDVGYGKTEVAMRAAYKCVLEGKQACFLVPTTVLATQHYETFLQRCKDFPVTVEVLSRFRTPKEQKEILERIQTGKVDIVIGTHRLLSKDVSFHDLGLLIVDEEQRFGVTHKERIKKLRQLVDVLTLTATPIPRTLHMALMGIRDLSTIETPPRDRLAIKTYLAKFDERVIQGAIEREIKRGGQVFFVHNRVQTINAMAGHIKRLVPMARVGIAHGQLKERELEEIMMKFLLKKIDVMVCTVIIESGLDIPSANTIIINYADRFGLSQIYQLRGRVGRSSDRAYAYLLIPGESTISEEAKKRLKVLMDFTELGAGFKIAFHDLQIRGGGEILGPAQSGHIAAVGYEMYLQLLEEAVNEIKGTDVRSMLDPEVNLHIPAFIPEAYIGSIDQRLSMYKRIANIESPEIVDDMREELQDRFGNPPKETLNLLEIIRLKNLLRTRWVKRLDLKGDTLIFSFEENGNQRMDKLIMLVQNKRSIYRISPEGILFVKMRREKTDPINEAKKALQEMFESDSVSASNIL